MRYRRVDLGAREHDDRLVMALDSRQKGCFGEVVSLTNAGCRVGRWFRRASFARLQSPAGTDANRRNGDGASAGRSAGHSD
jgi:hypothetical protein